MEGASERVDAWLARDEDAESVVSFARGGESEFGDFDDSQYRLVEEEPEAPAVSKDAVADVALALERVAEAAQRKAVCGFHRLYSRGRMSDVPDYGKRSPQHQRFFRLEGFMQLSSLDDPALVDALSAGVVRSRLSAQTGMGKTMKLPGLLASKCGLRVCQLELDNDVAATALKFQKKLYGIPGGAKTWCRQKKAYLTCMSYADFRGVVLSGSRDRLFEDFDVFYMDEAHEPLAAVWAARQYFAAFAKEHNSLLVASATMSTVESNNEVASGVGKFVTERTRVTLEEAMNSDKLVGEFLRDRTQVLVSSDEDVAMLRAYYVEMGIDVYILDNASTIADREAVVKAFSVSTAVTPRVVVSTENYGTGYNIPLSFVITTCTRRVYEMDAAHALVEKEVPLMRRSVVQHQGRVGRGLATGSGGWCLSPDTAPDRELLASEALEAYLSLVAASISPRPGMFTTVVKVLPKGVDAGVARMVLRSSLPPALCVRYLGTDGRFAAKFLEGVRLFHQSGENLRKSKDELPVGYESWTEEVVGGYYEGDETVTRTVVPVPFASPRGLKIQMHAISAVAESYLELDYWDWCDEEEQSDNEEIGVRMKARRRVLPRLPEAPVQESVASVATVSLPWQYDADPEAAKVKKVRRRGMSWTANGEGKMAVTTLVRALEDASLGSSVANPQFNVPEFAGKVAYSLPLDEDVMVPVKSAGGGKILLVTTKVHEAFMKGEALSPAAAGEVLSHICEIRAIERFAKSTVFDNWSPAWLSWFSSLAADGVFEELKRRGLHSDAVKLLGMLYDRFRSEVLSVAASSNLYRDKLASFFRSKPSVSKFVSAVRKGKLPIAQSDSFVSQVLRIKDAYDVAVMTIEVSGVFAPGLVTSAQRRLPIRDRGRKMGVIDEDVVSRDKSMRLETERGKGSWRK